MSEPILYLDHAAATPMDHRVLEAMLPYMKGKFYNPSSPYSPAVQVRREYQDAKARLAGTFGGRADEIIITAGATESINLAFTAADGHVVASAIEHETVLACARQHPHTFVKPTDKGLVSPEVVRDAITKETQLVSVQLANNELGTIQPIRAIADVIKEVRAERQSHGDMTPLYFHCDASQGFGQIDVHAARLSVDMLTLNAGKMYGPKQTALLWVRPGIVLQPLVRGGGQERGYRSGTENVAGVIGFAKAAELASSSLKHENQRLADLRDAMQAQLTEALPQLVISGHVKKRLPGSLHVSVPGLDAERLIFALETRGVLLATGSACAANKGTRSHVLTAIGMSDMEADGSLRITLGRHSDQNTCEQAATIIVEEVRREQARVARRA